MTQMALGGGGWCLAAEGGCRSTLHEHPCLFQHSPKGNFRGFFRGTDWHKQATV